ncbi:EscU/YscU/HrcU family type III secretion system export apparatus switch protein [Clostridium massiliodielmoense]|uniref:EscU/YscU/HrcU family type III secretion system export apparatus switch protein n=1 Tax=Clostridium massiliodielmoense TaxID=1776385 RepID=UPI000166A310|nr:EscU/YscU/HrcU family type III secretion system export apparatus switch protein [Clostridium massiliodielmoense]EDS78680.1 flagella-associated protein [Clostridium botulinum C str. Eklund]KEH99258.1 flagellar biogenesis protein [Clostridium botulinum C/D str. BKT12695]NEZ49521.1 flagellar biogenesis protein [Clostridium botulinum]
MDKSNRKKAAALKYEMNYDAPIVSAAGMGHVADKIIEEAEKSEVPVVYNKELAELLTNVDVGSYIPEELYNAVAEVIAYIMDVDKLANGR